jgi:hypothetical protein
MNAMPWFGFGPVLLFALPALAWYIAVVVLLFKIWQELRAIRMRP